LFFPWSNAGARAEARAEDCRSGIGLVRAAVLGLGVIVLAGCSSGPPEIQTETVDFEVGARANDDNALAVDLVLVFDTVLASQLSELTAATWFKTRDQVQLANPTGIEVRSFEVIPGQPGTHVEISGRSSDAVGAFLFADYASPGPHRARIDGMPAVLLRLGGKDFAVVAPSS
jgi:type VI secretion system protein